MLADGVGCIILAGRRVTWIQNKDVRIMARGYAKLKCEKSEENRIEREESRLET